MTTLEMVLLSLLSITFAALVYTLLSLPRMSRALQSQQRSDFAKCVAHMASVVSNRMIAQALRAEADRYDQPSEQRVHRSLAEHHYVVGGPSMPVIWLRHRADVLDPDHASGPVKTEALRTEAMSRLAKGLDMPDKILGWKR